MRGQFVTPEALRSLIAGAETLDVEFKCEEARFLSDGDLVEAVVCLANRPGNATGWLLVEKPPGQGRGIKYTRKAR